MVIVDVGVGVEGMEVGVGVRVGVVGVGVQVGRAAVCPFSSWAIVLCSGGLLVLSAHCVLFFTSGFSVERASCSAAQLPALNANNAWLAFGRRPSICEKVACSRA